MVHARARGVVQRGVSRWGCRSTVDGGQPLTERVQRRMKGHGSNLKASHLSHFLRLPRPTLAVVLLYVWVVAFGSRATKNGQRSLVDRPDRRDFSILRIGLNMIERLLTNAQPVTVVFVPYF